MSFGAFCPLPFRLRASQLDGWVDRDYLRFTADLVAARRALPFAVLRVYRNSTEDDAELLEYLGQHDDTQAPTVSISSGLIQVTWPEAMRDGLGVERPLRIVAARVGVEGTSANTASATVDGATLNQVVIEDTAGGEMTATVAVYASWGDRPRVESYGGAPDKRNCSTETVPYAYQWYQELGAALGSAYGQQTRGSVHARRLALSRALGAALRTDERARANTVPGTSDTLLDDWRRSLAVPMASDDPNWLVRQRCATKFAALSGQDIVALESSLRELLGDRFVAIRTFDVDDPPGTWPNYYDLGNGVWASTRSKILVDVLPPADTSDREFSNLMNVQLVRLLDTLTPAWTVFDWTAIGDGFFLDESPLDFTGL